MKSLIIDCSAGMSVYIINENDVYSKVDENQKKHTDELLVVVDELLIQSGLKINQIENICVCIGPGSFTGIRVAISICKGLAVNSNAKICIASNFDIYEVSKDKNSILVLDGFSKFVYIRKMFEGKVFEDCIDISDIKKFADKNFEIYVQNKKLQNILKNSEIYSMIAQNNVISYFKDKINNNEFINLNQICPLYLRASQAEMERNARLAGDKQCKN